MLKVIATAAVTVWGTPATFPAYDGDGFGATPRTAIAVDGSTYTAWREPAGALVASADGTAPVTIAPKVSAYATGVAPGRAAVAYVKDRRVHLAVRGGRDRVVLSGDPYDLAFAADPRGGWLLATERAHHVVVSDGVHEHDLGPGNFGDNRLIQSLVVTADGRVLLAYRRHERPALIERAADGTWGAPATFRGTPSAHSYVSDPTVDASGTVAALETTSCGDAFCSGFPLGARAGQALSGPPLSHPNRALAPSAANGVLVFSLKAGPKSFSTSARVRAMTLPRGPLQTLTNAPASEPLAIGVGGRRTLAIWATKRRWGAALAGVGGRFHATGAPTGPPPTLIHTADTNRDVRAAGHWAVVAWGVNDSVYISTRRF